MQLANLQFDSGGLFVIPDASEDEKFETLEIRRQQTRKN